MSEKKITLEEAINAVKTLDKVKEWAMTNTSWLSRSTDYAKGFADGIRRGQDIIEEIINENTIQSENI